MPDNAIVYRGFEFELRAADSPTEDSHELLLEGYAAVFDKEVDIGWFREKIAPGAFTKTLKESDQLALWSHDGDQPLARKSSGTLELREDDHGLGVVIKMDDRISFHNDAFHSVKRGDVKGMSFGFSVVKEVVTGDEDSQLRELKEVKLYEVSPTANPAYEATELEARSVLDRVTEGTGETTPEPGPAVHSEAERSVQIRKRQLQLTELED